MYILSSLIVCFLAIYGLISILLFTSNYRTDDLIDGNVFTVVILKDDTDSVEGFVRYLAWRVIAGYDIQNILLLHSGLNNEILKIVKKLSVEYSFIHSMTQEEYSEYIKTLIKNKLNS